MIRAVLFDFGGVIVPSPLEEFARYERERGLPERFIARLNVTNPDDNAWAKLERSEVDFEEFCRLFEAEAQAAGGEIDAREIMARVGRGSTRPEMVAAVRRCRERLKTALVTNNWLAPEAAYDPRELFDLFDVVIESSKVGVRKPDPRFYELTCRELEVVPEEAVLLDDLGVNLKPARAMGMTTIKVEDPDQALAELEAVVGFPLR